MRAACLIVVAALGCAPQEERAEVQGSTRFSTSVPERVICRRDGGVRCDRLRAELFISGYLDPDAGACTLIVDPESCTVSGTCTAISPTTRTLTLDYFQREGSTRLLLAQARKDVNLRESSSVAFTEGDFVRPDECEHMPSCDNSLEGCPLTQPVPTDAGVRQRPVCDLDDDGRSNLDEVCAGTDPQR